MTTKLHTNFHFPKLEEVDPRDYGIAMFGIFIRTVERIRRKHQFRIERHRLKNERHTCCICKTTEPPRTKNGVKLWFEYKGKPICPECRFSMYRHSEETKRRLSEGKKGPKNPNYQKYGLLNPLFGKPNAKLAGPNNHKWKGGIADLNNRIRNCTKYGEWRARVFARDRYACMRCGDKNGGNIIVHHINPYHKIIELNRISTFEEALACYELWDIDNGITICEKCHIEIEKGAVW